MIPAAYAVYSFLTRAKTLCSKSEDHAYAAKILRLL